MAKRTTGSIDQARSGFVVTPSDANDIKLDAGNAKYGWEEVALRIGTAGNLRVTFADDDAVTNILNVKDGEYIPGIVRKVHAAGTTATNIVAFAK